VIFLTSCIGQIAEASLPKNRKLVTGMVVLTLGIAVVTLALWQQSLVGLIAAIAFAGLGHGVAFKSGLSAISALTPANQASEVTATYFVVVYVAISIPVLIIGALEGPLGLPLVAVGYGAASALLSAAACLLILRRG
jgi:dipeptide/tripeptide permease